MSILDCDLKNHLNPDETMFFMTAIAAQPMLTHGPKVVVHVVVRAVNITCMVLSRIITIVEAEIMKM